MIMHGEILICKYEFFSHRARAHASSQPAASAHELCMWILDDSWIMHYKMHECMNSKKFEQKFGCAASDPEIGLAMGNVWWGAQNRPSR